MSVNIVNSSLAFHLMIAWRNLATQKTKLYNYMNIVSFNNLNNYQSQAWSLFKLSINVVALLFCLQFKLMDLQWEVVFSEYDSHCNSAPSLQRASVKHCRRLTDWGSHFNHVLPLYDYLTSLSRSRYSKSYSHSVAISAYLCSNQYLISKT